MSDLQAQFEQARADSKNLPEKPDNMTLLKLYALYKQGSVGDVEGDVDVRTFLGLAGPRAGFTAIRVTGRVASPNATEQQLQELCTYVQDTSPVRDSLANPIPVTTTLQIAH